VVTASDEGRPSLMGTMELVILVLDANDNAPQFNQSVYKVQLPENSERGVLVVRLNATDLDEGTNRNISYSLQQGPPPRRASRRLQVPVLDVNDNAPAFTQAVYTVLVRENNAAGEELARLWARDPDEADNGRVSYSVVEGGVGAAGLGSGWHVLWARVAWSSPVGQVVAKIRAVDADSGYNAWLRYELLELQGQGPFRVGLYSGEVSTVRALEEVDGAQQRLVIMVRDHGEPSRSTTATLSLSLLEFAEATLAVGAGLRPAASVEGGALSSTNIWLVVAICAVSSVFLLAVVLYGVSRWAPPLGVLSGAGPTTLVCASEVGSWSYSQRQSRSLCVAEGAGKSDLMVFTPNFPLPLASPAAKETQPSLLDT
ncbi:PREDICTED: protocadherin alpha-3-like, partial [Buceros rhinoceros silvestris]|uniref:protocadherin alpha-3-like n=1 Tax=Buceros rhinoceros silvestris TaxID=175836 RepID=UPI000528C0A4